MVKYIYNLIRVSIKGIILKIFIFSKIDDCYFTMKRLMDSGTAQEDAWNQTSLKLTQASEVYIIFYK